MRTILYILIFILSISLVNASLSDYPEPFVKNHYADNLALVVSGSEVVLYSIVSADIATGIAPVQGNAKTVLDKELLTGYQNYDLILIGNPCRNTLTAKFLSNEYCKFNPGEAKIKLVNNGNNKALVVMGYNFDAIRNAGLVLKNYNKYNLIGDELTIKTTGSDIQVSKSTTTTTSQTTTQTKTPIITIPEGCQGCLIDKTCLQDTQRLFDEYCQNSILQKQKANLEECNQNHECISNNCENKICSQTSLLSLILNWLKNTYQSFI